MNLNEKCLLKFLTNPISSFSKEERGENVISKKNFKFLSSAKNELVSALSAK